MGKKVKKDDKGPPEDVFDPLLVESKQAATVVLMLASPEEDVLAQACEAIYKFVDKCDENKKTLLDLGVVDSLLPLLEHEDKIVRRNACMVLGVMAGYVEVRKALRKREETIPAMVRLLGPEEGTVVHEFAALCLGFLSNDFSSKAAIFDQNGLEPLIACLTSDDPDVQKNCIETIASLLQDYQPKAAIRELEGFPTILELLKSEYSVVQHLALVALQRATEDAENRECLRELDAVNKFIDFIGHPELSDLHVYAVMVLSNLLEDTQTMEMIKENGGLQKLVAFVTDKSPPEEDDKKGIKEKSKSRAGKKSKGDEESMRGTPKPNEKHKKSGGGGGEHDPVTPTLPEVKEHASKAIARAAKNADNRKLLHEQEAEKMLILLLYNDEANVQVAAAQALGVMCENLICRESIGHWDGIEPMIKMLKSDSADAREAATMALANLTTSNMHNCSEVLRLRGVEPLIEILSDSREQAIANAACVLTNMAPDEALRAEIQRLGVVQALIESLKSLNSVVQSKASLAIAAFVTDAESRALFRESSGVDPLVALLTSGNDEVRRSSSWAVTVIAVDEATASEVCKYGGLEILQDIQLSSTRKNAFTDVALDRLLDGNLSAKYALTGYLGPHNRIANGFFDAGQQKPDKNILSLEEHCKLDVNQKRPVLLINAMPGKPVMPEPQASDPDMLATRSSVSGRASKQMKGKKQTKEEKLKEEEQLAQQQMEADEQATGPQAFVPPGDTAFMKYVEEVHDRIQLLPTTKDQVVALAQYVGEKLGGPIDRGQLANFSWELPLSQIKYDLNSNVIPIGMIKAGIHYHRALLFKALADRIAVSCSLVRGEYNRAWNEVMLTDDGTTPGAPKYPPKAYIVDLIHQPGSLMRVDSSEAINYQKL